MKVLCANVARASLVVAGVLGFADLASARAVPAGTATFDGGNCTAKFVRSASGIVMETKRECVGDQNPWVDADVVIQFRPLSPGSKPNPACDTNGLVTTFVWSNSEESLAPWLGIGEPYNVCVYLENAMVASGMLDSADVDGVTTDPVPLPGRYQVCVSGTWANRGGTDLLDAEYVSQDAWATFSDGLPASDPYAALGPNFGDVRVDGQFVDWGAYSAAHSYCTTRTLADEASITLAVFDGDGATNTVMPDWYADNVGTLEYTVKYLGP